ncbi:hypothetical protein FX983_06565 [Pseudomonas frederiksbergensis]|uniref:Uncharacterized protein n=1 Tax=Pseudomonas frederiksbergensis TaxID=104087 RepID=A0A6L5BPN4_9PSED|nr:hypothetical protein FX983_06565 [Pseudomonas frederiksbergensis]
MVVAAHGVDLEQVLPDLCEGDFRRALWCFVVAAGVGLGVGNWQGLAVEFAVGCQRQRFEADEGAWQHVFGQLRCQLGAQVGGGQDFIGLRDHISNQSFFARRVFADDDGGFFYAGALA